MPDFEGSTLWRTSAFDLLRKAASSASHVGLKRQTLISTTLQAELRLLDRRSESADVLEVLAACVRLRESALVYLQCDGLVWPVTVFPTEELYHSPRSLMAASERVLRTLAVIDVEPAGVRPPGHWMHDRIAKSETYHALTPALWRLALLGPRSQLLTEIGGTAAYRALRNPANQQLAMPGAIAPVLARLRKQAASLPTMAGWPGMSMGRASRVLNALYLTSHLLVSRSHHAARSGPIEWLFGARRR